MSKRKDYECPYTGCTKEFKDGMNQENFNRHVNSCKFKTTKKKKGGIVSYFTAQPPLPTLSESNNTPSTSYDCTNIADEIEITSNVNTEVETIQVGQIREDAGTARKECKGFLVEMEKGSVLSNYPFHRHDPENSDTSVVIPFNISLQKSEIGTTLFVHTLNCNGYIPKSATEDIKKECADIRHSPTMNKLLEITDSENPRN